LFVSFLSLFLLSSSLPLSLVIYPPYPPIR
jgi:hypothetical protein